MEEWDEEGARRSSCRRCCRGRTGCLCVLGTAGRWSGGELRCRCINSSSICLLVQNDDFCRISIFLGLGLGLEVHNGTNTCIISLFLGLGLGLGLGIEIT